MKKPIVIKTKRLIIKNLRVSDISDNYVNGLNDGQVNKYLVGVRQQKQTYKTVREYVEGNIHSPSCILFGLFDKADKKLIGTVRINDISYFQYYCYVGICVFDKSYWGLGLAREALNETVSFAFKNLGLHYIEGSIYQENKSSIQLFKKCGFKKVAAYKDKYRYDDSYKSVLSFGKINPDFNMGLLKKSS